uniref:D-glutamate cyclase-like C-terminal domain-containing protein n=1 Tax=Ditylum brightwellii TaxID=49249 RepID=A0A7S1ZNL2_9STRA
MSSQQTDSSNSDVNSTPISTLASNAIHKIEERIGRDEGGRGMRHLVVPGDLLRAAETLARLRASDNGDDDNRAHVVVLSGFPCRVNDDPPTETDGPPGALAIARAAVGLGHRVTIVTDTCNEKVFRAACRDVGMWATTSDDSSSSPLMTLEAYPSEESMTEEDRIKMNRLALRNKGCDLVIACERAGPAQDGRCYTMGGVDMNAKDLIAPLHQIVMDEKSATENEETQGLVRFIGVGDGGNEMGMGKVLESVRTHIKNGSKIAAVTPADCLIAASVSNWGGYALGAAAAVVRYDDQVRGCYHQKDSEKAAAVDLRGWVERCVPTEQDEIELLDRCVQAGCRDGVSGKMESTVDGMPLETSLNCLREIRSAALSMETEEEGEIIACTFE